MNRHLDIKGKWYMQQTANSGITTEQYTKLYKRKKPLTNSKLSFTRSWFAMQREDIFFSQTLLWHSPSPTHSMSFFYMKWSTEILWLSQHHARVAVRLPPWVGWRWWGDKWWGCEAPPEAPPNREWWGCSDVGVPMGGYSPVEDTSTSS